MLEWVRKLPAKMESGCSRALGESIMETGERPYGVLFGVSLPRERNLLDGWDCDLSQLLEFLFNIEKKL